MNKIIISLSHNDLDGFGAQYFIYKNFKEKIYFFNTDYINIIDYLEKIKNIIDNNKDKEIILIITDLSFNKEQFEYLYNNFLNLKLIFIDHHKTTYINFINFSEYNSNKWGIDKFNIHWKSKIHTNEKLYLENKNWKLIIDLTKSASLLTYENLENNSNIDKKIFEYINIYDLWKIENKNFFRSIFLSNLIFFNYPLFEEEQRLLKFYLIENIFKEIEKNISIRIIEKDLNNLIFQFLKKKFSKELNFIKNYFNIDDLDINTLISLLQYEKIVKNAIKITKNNYEILLLENLHQDIIQYGLLSIYKKYKNMVLINLKKENNVYKFSIRSDNNKAIEIANLFNGGGHPNAAGANTKLSKEEIINLLQNF